MTDRLFSCFRSMRLQAKFTLVLTLSVFIPAFFAGLFLSGQIYGMVISDSIRKEQETASKTLPKIEEVLSQVHNAVTELTGLPFYHRLFGTPIEGSVASMLESEEAGQFAQQLRALTDKTLLTGIRFVIDLPEEELLPETESLTTGGEYSALKRYFSSLQDTNTYWRGIFQSSHPKELYCPSFYLGEDEKREYGNVAYIFRTILTSGGNVHTAYVAAYWPDSVLNGILSDNLTLENSVSYIINDRDSIVSSSDEQLSGTYWLSYKAISDSFLSSMYFVPRTILGKKLYVCFYSIRDPGWYMVTVLPEAPMIRKGNQIMLRLIMIYLLAIIAAAITSVLLSRSITGRISSVIGKMSTARSGIPVPMDEPTVNDEIGDLIDTYNYMTRKMAQLMEDQAKASEELRIAEFNALQAQINPHFLYNTMDMINWLAKQGRTDEISDAVQDLSRFYRLTLSRKQTISTIEDEEEHVTIYVRLQNMRFSENIELISDIPDELKAHSIPKLTLQPVIENAILHGIREKEDKSGTIVLTGWTEDGDIVLLVSDDGIGIPSERLSTILTGNGQGSGSGTNIAIYNTHRRLQLLYGKKYGLTYHSQPGEGTEVEIRIPLES